MRGQPLPGELLCGLFRLDPPNPQTPVDAEQAVASLNLGWEVGVRGLHRDDLGPFHSVGVPFADDGGGPLASTFLSQSVFNP
jgi:hypothetical protein